MQARFALRHSWLELPLLFGCRINVVMGLYKGSWTEAPWVWSFHTFIIIVSMSFAFRAEAEFDTRSQMTPRRQSAYVNIPQKVSDP
jgi:hypothetical protein